MAGARSTSYEVRARFRAPLEYVFRWCTDFEPGDAKYGDQGDRRRIISRTPRTVVYQDLGDVGKGWDWTQHTVRLMPPNRWHSDSVGNFRVIALDYRLKRLPNGDTELVLKGKRRPYGIGGKNPSRAEWTRSVGAVWKRYAPALERDYRKSRGGARK